MRSCRVHQRSCGGGTGRRWVETLILLTRGSLLLGEEKVSYERGITIGDEIWGLNEGGQENEEDEEDE